MKSLWEPPDPLFYILKFNSEKERGVVLYDILGHTGFNTSTEAREWLKQESPEEKVIIRDLTDDMVENWQVVIDYN